MVKYAELAQALNWRDCAVAPPAVPTALVSDWQGNQPCNQLNAVKYELLMKDLFPGAGEKQQ